MNHTDHVNLIKGGIVKPGGIWADFGSGIGAFTFALADLLGPSGQIISVDKDKDSLAQQESIMRELYPQTPVFYHHSDYTKPLYLPLLDGIVLANTLHFLPTRIRSNVLQLMRTYLQPDGHLILIEYDTDKGNQWVPHPFSFQTWQTIAQEAGFTKTTLLASRPSRFMERIYAALSL